MGNLIKVAILNIFRRKARTFLALLGILIGISALIILVSVVDGIYKNTAETLSTIQGLMVYKEDSVSPIFDTLSTTYEAKLRSISGIKTITPTLIHTIGELESEMLTFQGPSASYKVIGIYPTKIKDSAYAGMVDKITSGDNLDDSDTDYALISERTAEDYKKSIGSNIKIDGHNFKVKGIFKSESDLTATAIFITPKDLRNLYSISADRVNYLYVVPINPSEAKNIEKKIEFKYEELVAYGQQELMNEIGGVLDNLKLLVIIVSIVAAIVAGIGVINTMLMSVMERTKEIGTLKAVGWTKDNVIKMILLESVFIGSLGGILGIILGFIGSYYLSVLIPTYVSLTTVIESFLFAFLLGLIGGLYPAWIASAMDPVEALRVE